MVLVFFIKQKTAYEMRISDWSSDVCSSDLPGRLGEKRRQVREGHAGRLPARAARDRGRARRGRRRGIGASHMGKPTGFLEFARREIGRASCRERVGRYV